MTQNERIIRHLNEYGSITPLEALSEYGIMRLASRISDLRTRGGYDIRREMVDEAFKNSGLMNPYTDKPISSKAEYDEYKKAFAEDKKKQLQLQAGLSEAEYAAMIKELPEVKQAQAAAEKAEKAMREADEAKAKAKIDEQIKEIGKLDPDIKELGDLTKMENYQAFYDFVRKGNTLLDAYRLANFDQLINKSTAATKQAAYNNINSKQHMGKTKERGTGAVAVPNDVKEIQLSADGITTQSKTIKFTGEVVFKSDLSTEGSTTINGANITTGTITGRTISGGTITGATITGNTISGGTITSAELYSPTIYGSTINIYGENDSASFDLWSKINGRRYDILQLSSWDSGINAKISSPAGGEITLSGNIAFVNGPVYFYDVVDFSGATVKGLS